MSIFSLTHRSTNVNVGIRSAFRKISTHSEATKHFDQMDLEQEKDPDIGWENLVVEYAVSCFKNWFHAIDSDLLFVALYLHQLNSRNLTNVKSFLFQRAERWNLSSKASALLWDNVDGYHNSYSLQAQAIGRDQAMDHLQQERERRRERISTEKRWKTRQVGGTTIEEIEDYNELEIIGDLEEVVSADEDLNGTAAKTTRPSLSEHQGTADSSPGMQAKFFK
ncbi:hypothetical protein BT69DRAFT_1297608 [Atractiella rhizophila]|nr:hypothetical protein BT69DRAFT_1297608 [Atractiella rhizophila]